MARVRKNVYKLPAGDTTLDWYAKAVEAMRARPSTDPTSWNYQAAMHGFKQQNPYWNNVGAVPPQSEQTTYWNQCQHGSWHFLPWHRMYLAYFEQIVAATIAQLGGPADWSLPFWDYSDTSNPNALNIPPAFTKDTAASNPLQMPAAGKRPGRESNSVLAKDTTLDALKIPRFAGVARGAAQGFGGPVTPFSHSGGAHGGLEHLPHDFIHVDIGGAMGDPNTAALDPIFWLHHANIDRLWQVWLNNDPAHTNPVASDWLTFAFDFHDSQGKPVTLTTTQVLDTTTLLSGYTYEGVPAGAAAAPSAAGKEASPLLSANLSAFSQLALSALNIAPEVLAATNDPVVLGEQASTTTLDFLPPNRRRAVLRNAPASTGLAFADASLAGGAAATSAPLASEAYLNFENITGTGIPPVYDVYLDAAPGDSHYAGSLPFFGVAASSEPSVHHNGSGQRYVLDISELAHELEQDHKWDESTLHVRLQPRHAPDAESSVQIGRISLYVK